MKTAIVTGSSYGIGYSISSKLLQEGYKVYGISRSETKINDNNFVWLKCDLYNHADIKDIINLITEDKIDLLVNNAGTAFKENALELTDESFERMFSLNFKAQVYITNLLKNKLSGGLILNTSSTSDRWTGINYGLYSASKAALTIYFDAIALENKDLKIINILPSYVDTPLQHKLNDKDKDDDFEWNNAMDTEKVADAYIKIVKTHDNYPNCSKIMVVSNKLIGDTEDPEKLYYYNVDTEEFKKLK
jgi:short-subunit dehydrogenase